MYIYEANSLINYEVFMKIYHRALKWRKRKDVVKSCKEREKESRKRERERERKR